MTAIGSSTKAILPTSDVEAGRAYVGKYVPFIHDVERLYLSATSSAPGHEEEAAAQHEE